MLKVQDLFLPDKDLMLKVTLQFLQEMDPTLKVDKPQLLGYIHMLKVQDQIPMEDHPIPKDLEHIQVEIFLMLKVIVHQQVE
jgi:hypothetical protein